MGLRLVLDSLRYWLTEMQVDGFRFDLAVTVARETNNYVFNSFEKHGAFFKSCAQDPIINKAILIGEPWDIGGFGYRVGQFPAQWSEQNDRYRDTVRSFWRGDQGCMGDFATRLLGSRDIYPKNLRSINSSGLANGEEVKFYAADGKFIGQAVATNGTASYAVSEALVIAKVGNNSIKIAIK